MGSSAAVEGPLPHLVYYVASSLDGYIADADGGVGWLPQPEGDEDFGYGEFYAGVDALLMGRRTYDQVRGFGDWPYAGKPVRVWTRRELHDAPAMVRATAGAPADVVRELYAEGFGRVWLVGGAELAEALRREGLVDEWIVTVVGRTLGDGVPLFGGPEDGLQVVQVDGIGRAAVQLRLVRRARPQEPGGAAPSPA